MSGDYREVLSAIHQHSRPRTYLEIGMLTGATLALARPETMVIGVDPLPAVWTKINADAQLFFETSDDFFAQHDIPRLLGGLPIDFAFIDGMHLFEFALRDFTNIERNAAPGSVVTVHDCLPREAAWASRERITDMWTGDTWKVVCCLSEMRPDLEISTITAGPSGLAIIRNLDPTNTVLQDRYEEAMDRFLPLTFDYIDGRQQESLKLIPNDPDGLAEMVPPWPEATGRVATAAKRYPRSWPVARYRARRLLANGARRARNPLGRTRAPVS